MVESRSTEAVMAGALFREIHKNAWLKRLAPPDNKKSGAVSKKGERVWVVFCVHDDTEAFLEGYSDSKMSAAHVPDWFFSLNTTLHISPTICPHEQEYEFVVTLGSDVVRLTAPSWELMQEWVETMRSKLREMRILSPRENVYSRMPEARPPLLPTRDPTSPLPATPPVPAAIVPGVERIGLAQSQSNHSSSQGEESSVNTVMAAAGVESSESNPAETESQTNILSSSVSSIISASSIVSTSLPLSSSVSTGSNHQSSLVSSGSNQQSSLVSTGINSSSIVSTGSVHPSSLVSTGSGHPSSLVSTGSGHPSSLVSTGSGHPSSSVSTGSVHPSSLVSTGSGHQSSLVSTGLSPSSLSSTSPSSSVMSTGSNHQLCFVSNGLENVLTQPINKTIDKECNSIATPLISNRQIFSFNTNLNVTGTSERRRTSEERQTVSTVLVNEHLNNVTLDDVTSHANNNSENNTHNDNVHLSFASQTSLFVADSAVVPSPRRKQKLLKINKTLPDNFGTSSSNQETNHGSRDENLSLMTNITIIQVSNLPHSAIPVTSSHGGIFNFNFTQDSHLDPETQPLIINNSYDDSDNVVSLQNNSQEMFNNSTVQIIPSVVESSSKNSVPSLATSKPQISINKNINDSNITLNSHYESVFLPLSVNSNSSNVTTTPLAGASHVGNSDLATASRIPPKSPKFSLLSKQQRSASHSELQINRTRIRLNENNAGATRSVPKCTGPIQGSTNVLTRGLTELQINRAGRTPVNKNDPSNESSKSARNNMSQVRYTTVARVVDNEGRRRSLSTSESPRNSGGNPANRNMTAIDPQRIHSHARLTLREQQVLQLRREMQHPGGVRLTLRRKDCVASIALVEAFKAVWIAGWKQKEHPMLYNALHIGDRLVSIGGVVLNNAAEAHKVIRTTAGLYIELIIRRVPFGRVYAIRKETDSQCLGLIQDSNTATIVEIIPNSLVARHGLPPRAKTCDGLSLTSWVLTEINGRPLNLFFKENEVKDRLNAIGREISILVQPLDLIKMLKKQLKSLRGYKDYIVQ